MINLVHCFKISSHLLPVFSVHNSTYLICKRIFDFTTVCFLLLLTSPLFIVIALLIRLTSPGPVFFTQQRVGLRRKLFTIYKFRTMFLDAPRYAVHPRCRTDNRITSFGRWLRRSSLDELPQLFNILQGEMSLVGPRPEMPFIVEQYGDKELRRLSVKPGLTGLWQISQDRNQPIHHNLHHDLYYIEHASLYLDWKIMMMTPLKLTLGKNRGQ